MHTEVKLEIRYKNTKFRRLLDTYFLFGRGLGHFCSFQTTYPLYRNFLYPSFFSSMLEVLPLNPWLHT